MLIVLFVNVVFVIALTFIQIEHNEELPSETTILKLIGNGADSSNTYYMNGESDLKDVEAINNLIFNQKVIKLSKLESYKFIFSVSKNNYILVCKTLALSENNGIPSNIIIYEKNDTIYIVSVLEVNDNKDVFAVYKTDNNDIVKDLINYKAQSNRYFVFHLPDWRYDLLSFNLEGKLIIASMIFEFVVCFAVFQCLLRKQSKTIKPKQSGKKQ